MYFINRNEDGKPAKIPELKNPKSFSLNELEPLDERYNSGIFKLLIMYNICSFSDTGIDLLEVTTLEQRFDQPEFQPQFVSSLYPRRLTMGVKRSIRCKVCEHNLLKPEFSPRPGILYS